MLGPKSPRALPGKVSISSPENVRGARHSRTLRFWTLLAPLVFLAATGCADAMMGANLEQDVAQLRQDLGALTLSAHRSRGDTETVLNQLERRTRDQQVESQKQLAALSSRTEALEKELAGVSTRVEEISRQIEQLSRKVKAAPATPAAGAPRQIPGAAPTAAGSQPAQVYQAAYIDFSKGNYSLAMSGFREFLRMFPDSDLADNAQYWVGEAHFSLARTYATQGQPDKVRPALEQAVQEFRKVIVNYPRGDKAPTALYKEALALLELKQQSLARVRLQYLVDHFSQSEEAPLARERLAALKESKESEER